MASVKRDRDSWIMYIRLPFCTAGTHKRIPAGMLASDDRDHAMSFALEVERYARQIETGPLDMSTIKHAVKIGALSAVQAEQSFGYMRDAAQLSLLAISDTHPATIREKDRWPVVYRTRTRYLSEFVAWLGSDDLRMVTFQKAYEYVQDLTRRGYAPATRSHQVCYLRRCCSLAPRYGLPDVLNKMRLDAPSVAVEPLSLSSNDIGRVIRYLLAVGHYRGLVVFSLGTLAGLRPSELCRLEVADLAGDVLAVGTRVRKAAASCRYLPLPAVVCQWVNMSLAGRSAGRICSIDGRPITLYALRQFWERLVPDTLPYVPVKCFRKSFFNLAVELGCPIDLIEQYGGHALPGAAPVTLRHYLRGASADRLRPVSVAISDWLGTELGTAIS